MSNEQVIMRLEVLKGEAMGRLRNRFMAKVQLDDQVQDNEIKLHWERGYLEGLISAQKELEAIKKGEEMENLRDKRDGVSITLDGHRPEVLLTPIDSPLFDVTIIVQNVPVKNL